MNKYKDFLEEKVFGPIERFWDRILNIPDTIKDFIMRGIRGYADSDIWSLDIL